MKENENKIKVNVEAKHFDILPKSDSINLRSGAKPRPDRPEEAEAEFFKKRNSGPEAEKNNVNDDYSSDEKEKSGKGFLEKFRIKRSSQQACLPDRQASRGSMEPTDKTMKLAALGRIFDKAILGLIYLLVFSLPLFILPFSTEVYEFNKTILLFVISSLAFLLWIIKMVLIDRRIVFARTALDIPIVIFVLLIIISTAFSLDKISSVLGFYGRFLDSLLVYLSLAMVYFTVVNVVTRRWFHSGDSPVEPECEPFAKGLHSPEDSGTMEPAFSQSNHQQNNFTDNILKIFLASAFIVVISSLLYSFGFKFIPWQETEFRSFNLISGSVNVLGIYLVVVILIALGYCGRRRTNDCSPSGCGGEMPLLKNFVSALIIMSVILLAIIDFMAAWIVLAVSLMVVLALAIASRFHSPKGTMEPASGNNSFIFSFSIFLISLVFIISSLTAVNKNANSDFASSSISNSIKNRILSSGGGQVESDRFIKEVILDKKTAISVAADGLKSDPVAGIIGSGPGTYLYNFSKFKPSEFNNSAFWNIRFDKAGSEILEKISTIGILGALSYLAIMFLAMGMFLKMTIRWLHSGDSPVEPECEPFAKGFHSPEDSGTMEPSGSVSRNNVYLFAAWFSLLLFQFLYLEATTTKFIFWLFTAILAAEYVVAKRLHSPEARTMEPADKNYFILDLRKEKSAFYPTLLVVAVLLISFSASYYYQIRFYQAEAAYKDISIKQNKALEGVNLDNQRAWEILDQKASDIKSKVIEKNPYRGEYKAYLSDIYLQKTGIAFQEEGKKGEDEKNTQRIALEVKSAIDYIKDAADSNPNNIIFQHKIGSTYVIAARDLGVAGAGDWAIKKFNRAIELEPTNPVLYTELGKIFNLTDQTDLAIDQFKKALEHKANYIDAGLQLGLSYEKKEEKEKAIGILSSLGSVERIQNVIAAGQIVASANLDIDIAFQLGRIYYNTGKVSPAKDIFTKIIKINPNHSNAHYSLGLIYSSEGDKEKALKEFEAVLLLNPENEDVKNKINELKKGAASNVNAAEEVNNSEEEVEE